MPSQSDFFSADQAEVWVQPDGPNGVVYRIPCANVDAIDAPGGEVTKRLCRTPEGWVVSHSSRGAPSAASTSIEMYMTAVQSWLSRQEEAGCETPVYITHGQCPNGVFLNYDVVDMLRGAVISSKGGSGFARGKADAGEGAADATLRTYEMTGDPGAPEVYDLVLTLREIAELEQLNDIDFCNRAQCTGPCGFREEVCTDGMITAEFTTGLSADVWFTENGWVTGAASNAPFGAVIDETVTAGVCFHMDRDTVRHAVFRGTTSGLLAQVAYTDVAGAAAAWTVVTFGIANDFVQYGGSAFALSNRAIWVGVAGGEIYFSDDGCASWTAQGSGLASAIYSIHFADENYGMAVGAANVFAYTVDGGSNWAAGTGPNAGQITTGVRVIDSYRAWATSDDGTLWYTNDFGTNWTARGLPQTPDALGAIDLLDAYAISVVGFQTYGGDELAIVYRSFNGGRDWDYWRHDVAFDSSATMGLNAVVMCNYNHIYAVGEPANTTGLILELENATP